MVEAEHRIADERVRRVIELKRLVCFSWKLLKYLTVPNIIFKKVCDTPDKHFLVVNQGGIDPLALDMFAKEGILALRRAKRRNMERLTLACGGTQVNYVEDLTPDILGKAGLVYQQTLGEEKYTFVEKVENPFSCTILVKGKEPHMFPLIPFLRSLIRSFQQIQSRPEFPHHITTEGCRARWSPRSQERDRGWPPGEGWWCL